MEDRGDSTATENLQNFVTIRFVTKADHALIEPLKIFKAVGDMYQVNTPVIDGYVLVDGPDQLHRTMTTNTHTITLLYAKLGQVIVYHDRPDTQGDQLSLTNAAQAEAAKPLQLPAVVDHQYYRLTKSGIGTPISNPQNYLPTDITGTTSIISLTTRERNQAVLTDKPTPKQPVIRILADQNFDIPTPLVSLAKVWQQLINIIDSQHFDTLTQNQQNRLLSNAIQFSQALQKLSK